MQALYAKIIFWRNMAEQNSESLALINEHNQYLKAKLEANQEEEVADTDQIQDYYYGSQARQEIKQLNGSPLTQIRKQSQQ